MYIYIYIYIYQVEGFSASNISRRECPPDVMIKEMDCRIVVSEFVLQSRY